MFPLVFSKCEFTQTKEYAIKLKLKGKSTEKEEIVWNEGAVTVYGKCYKGKCHDCENFEDGECTVRL